MKLRTAIVTAIIAVVSFGVAGTAVAGPPSGSTTGDVTFNNGLEGIEFNAFDYGDTGDRGTVTYTNYSNNGFSYTADVTAVSVNVAAGTACFQYKVPADADRSAGFVLTFKVVDSGTPSNSPDGIQYSWASSGVAPDLDAACARLSPRPTDSGNLVVRSVR